MNRQNSQQFDDIHGASLLIGSEGRTKEAKWNVRRRMKRKSGYCTMYLFTLNSPNFIIVRITMVILLYFFRSRLYHHTCDRLMW